MSEDEITQAHKKHIAQIIAVSYRQGFMDAQAAMLRTSDALSLEREVKTEEWVTKITKDLGLE